MLYECDVLNFICFKNQGVYYRIRRVFYLRMDGSSLVIMWTNDNFKSCQMRLPATTAFTLCWHDVNMIFDKDVTNDPGYVLY